jgi:hypothetical protein
VEVLLDFGARFLHQLQSPTLAFLLGGILIAALGSRLTIPDSIYKFIVFMLLMKVGLKGGMAIGEADLAAMLLPALIAVFVGCLIVVIGRYTLAMLPGIRTEDGIATAGLFGAVSGSTLAAGMVVLESDGIAYEPWAAALYPFMDIPALVLAIVLASVYLKRRTAPAKRCRSGRSSRKACRARPCRRCCSASPSACSPTRQGLRYLLRAAVPRSAVGVDADHGHRGLRPPERAPARGPLVRRLRRGDADRARPDRVRAWLHRPCTLVGFSPGGVVLLAIIAGSSSDISGPPTLRAGIPTANPSSYIGASTSIGTPVAIAIGIPLYIGLAQAVFGV